MSLPTLLYNKSAAAHHAHKRPWTGTLESADTVLVVDAANLAARAFHTFCTVQQLRAHDGTLSGHVYGVLRMVEALFDKHGQGKTAIVFAFEGYPAHRYSLFPEYKGHRRVSLEEAGGYEALLSDPKYEQYQAMLAVPSHCVLLPLGEADDAIASVVSSLPSRVKKVVVSTDRDLWPLKRYGVTILAQAGSEVADRAALDKTGVRMAQIAVYKAFYGDSGDGLPKVPRIRSEWASEILKAGWTTLPSLDSLPGPLRSHVAPHWQQVQRVYEAVLLLEQPEKLVREIRDDGGESMRRLVDRYSMRSLAGLPDRWYGPKPGPKGDP